ncbi:hypothetical protein [Lentimicrobium sp. S6]|uniref:hypothetical protein n=1 Tax=Lentimicrobium sp. S6 TaxID=2735872 RepID=UPI001555C5B9|nr:hypothetical protein [Lentimicrobium sp. S6]NPD44304.1 hypothetical protein [Lentimicrobium sp. S6]
MKTKITNKLKGIIVNQEFEKQLNEALFLPFRHKLGFNIETFNILTAGVKISEELGLYEEYLEIQINETDLSLNNYVEESAVYSCFCHTETREEQYPKVMKELILELLKLNQSLILDHLNDN